MFRCVQDSQSDSIPVCMNAERLRNQVFSAHKQHIQPHRHCFSALEHMYSSNYSTGNYRRFENVAYLLPGCALGVSLLHLCATGVPQVCRISGSLTVRGVLASFLTLQSLPTHAIQTKPVELKGQCPPSLRLLVLFLCPSYFG